MYNKVYYLNNEVCIIITCEHESVSQTVSHSDFMLHGKIMLNPPSLVLWWCGALVNGNFPLWKGFLNNLLYCLPIYTNWKICLFYQLLSTLSSEGDGDMYGTTSLSILEYLSNKSSWWNLYTLPLKGSIIEPNDEVPWGIFWGSKFISKDTTLLDSF